MGIDALPSGSYRFRQMIKGKRYTLTFDHKPSKSDIAEALADLIREHPVNVCDMSFKKAVSEYLFLKKDLLSPKTRFEYEKLPNYFTKEFNEKPLGQITQADLDVQIASWLKSKKAYKTIKNRFDMVNTISNKYVGKKFDSGMLPVKPAKADDYIPSREEVKSILNYLKEKDPMFYVPIALATFGMRRGEVLALNVSDIDSDNVVHITKALSENSSHDWIVKEPKTQASIRDVPIPKELADYIRSQGYIYQGFPGSICKALTRIEKELGIEHFSLHKLRHFFVTELWQQGVPAPDIKRLGGYEKSSDVMEIVYTHSRIDQDKERRRGIIDSFSSSFM